jgi:hypothetical protein
MARIYGLTGEHSRRMIKKFVQQGRRRVETGGVPSGYVEDFDESRTLLADFFSILQLGFEKIEMIRRSRSMTNCQAMANGLGEIGLSCLYGVIHGFASCEMGRDGRGECATGAMRVGGIDKFPLEHMEESAVIEKIGGSFCR